MKYYSDKLKKFFDEESACVAAEKDYDLRKEAVEKSKKEMAEKRATRAKEVENSYKEYIEAQKKYNKLMNDFVKEFGSFHMTISADDGFDNLFDMLVRMI